MTSEKLNRSLLLAAASRTLRAVHDLLMDPMGNIVRDRRVGELKSARVLARRTSQEKVLNSTLDILGALISILGMNEKHLISAAFDRTFDLLIQLELFTIIDGQTYTADLQDQWDALRDVISNCVKEMDSLISQDSRCDHRLLADAIARVQLCSRNDYLIALSCIDTTDFFDSRKDPRFIEALSEFARHPTKRKLLVTSNSYLAKISNLDCTTLSLFSSYFSWYLAKAK